MSNHAFYTDTPGREPNRLLLCILLALLVHAGLLAVLPLLARGTPQPVVPSVDIQIQAGPPAAEPTPPAPVPSPAAQTPPPPTPVQVQAPPPPAVAKPAVTPPAAPKPSTDQAARVQPGAAPAPSVRAQPQAKVAQPRAPAPQAVRSQAAPAAQGAAVSAAPAVSPSASSGTSAGAGQGSGNGDFVIPTPKADATKAAAPAGSAFRESGARTGSSAALPAVASPPESAAVAAGSSGAATGPVEAQRSGQGVIVNGQKQSGGNLDLGQLDKALPKGVHLWRVRRPGSGDGSGNGERDRRVRRTRARRPGTLWDRIGTGGGPITWAEAGAGRARQLVNAPKPKMPAWVGSQGLNLSVTVTFTVGADGLVSMASVAKSSGYGDVDAAVLDAIRRWRFTAVGSAEPLHGTIPYVIRAE